MALACPPVRRTFSDEPGPGTFHSLGTLPKRTSKPSPRKPPVFHIHDDDEHSSFDEHVASQTVPFPRSTSPPSPRASPRSSSRSPPATPRSPPLSRGASVPILLSNGKPLKSSLKLSSSSPAMLTPPHHLHLRARSEPSTPATTPKNVHFPDKDYALATVRIFNCKARPAALSSPNGNGNGNGDETETEGEDAPSARFPFPRIPSVVNYEIDPTKSSVVPSTPAPHANLLLESLNLSSSSSSTATKPLLMGSILVRNLAFEKQVGIRFTLDDWQTVSEVGAHYVDSFPSLPSHLSSSGDPPSSKGKGWDRFTFTIRLEDYAPSLSTRTMWLAAHYRITSSYPQPGSSVYGPGGEWWDNNGDKNYRVAFRPAAVNATPPKNRSRSETVSAPIISSRTQLQPPTTCKEHVLGLMIASLKEIETPHENHRPSVPPRVGRLSLCNYVPPRVHTQSSTSIPSAGSSQSTSPSSSAHPELPPLAACRLSSDEESTSPASSTLSTPTVSPTIPPRVIIGGQPATYSDSTNEREDEGLSSGPVHVADWEWSAPNKPRMQRLARQRANLAPVSDALSSSRRGLDDPLYDAFVTQWCFAQGSPPTHSNYGDSGILA